jgi:hypothetical protein
MTQRHELFELEHEARLARVLFLYCKVDRVGAQRDAKRAAQLADQLGAPRLQARAQLPALLEAFGRGELAEAERLAACVFEAGADDPNHQMLYMSRLSTLRMLRGEGLRDTIGSYEALLASHPQAIGMRAVLASAYATLGRREDAMREFDILARDGFAALPSDINWLPTMSMLADAAVHLGDAGRASLIYDQLLPYSDQFFFFGLEACPGFTVAFLLGDLAREQGQFGHAEVWLERARAMNEVLEMPLLEQHWALARARLWLDSRAEGGVKAARLLLQGVMAFADRQGIEWLRRSVSECEKTLQTIEAAHPARRARDRRENQN